MSEKWRWLDTGERPGAWNMAVDEAIMAQVANGLAPPTIRVYGWNPPALSLGYFQNRNREVDLAGCGRKGFDCVRRPTGGRAVVHDREVTYAFIVPENHPLLPAGVIASYQVITRGILEGLRNLGVDAVMATPSRKEQPRDFGAGTTAACFDAPSWYEVTVSGKKLVGSAQVRRYGAVLQHGSILLDLSVEDLFAVLKFRSPELRARAERLFTEKATSLLAVLGRAVSPVELKAALREGWSKALGIELADGRLSQGELEKAAQLEREKYASEDWNGQHAHSGRGEETRQDPPRPPGALTFGFLGPRGTFSEQAALSYLQERRVERVLVPYSSLPGLISALEEGSLHEAVVPAENSIEGSLNLTLDLLAQGNGLTIIGEEVIPVDHHLLIRPGTDISRIVAVYSHPQALAQCRKYLKSFLPGAREIATGSTAEAAELVFGEPPDRPSAAIGTVQAAQLRGLEIAAREIQDVLDNFTRFLVLARESSRQDARESSPEDQKGPRAAGEITRGADERRFKTSVVFSTLTDRPGGLYEILGEFANRGLNLTRIESRPARRMLGEYLFFLDLIGHANDPPVREALAAIRPRTSFFRNLGSYPEAALPGRV
ncbi:MAG: prephenate dehydratase [Firmicutes bacterium]|nr:prephenate dehydratase [Bacillota bacterium]